MPPGWAGAERASRSSPALARGQAAGRVAGCGGGVLCPREAGLTPDAKSERPREPPPPKLLSPPPSSSSSLSLFLSQVVFPPGSPIPLRRTFSVLPSPPPPPSPLLQHRKDASSASSSPPPPSPPTPSTPGPAAIPCGPSGVQSTGMGLRGVGVQGPAPRAAASSSVRSIGCQTDEDPLFPPMQAGLPGPRPHLCLSLCSSGVPTLHTHVHTALCPSIHKVPCPSLHSALCLHPQST